MRACRGKEHQIARLDVVHAAGDDGLVPALDGHDVEQFLLVEQLGQHAVHQAGILAYLRPDQDQGAPEQLPVLARPGAAHGRHDLLRRQHLGVNHGADAQALEQLLVLGQQVLVIVDTRQRAVRPQVMGQQASRHVGCLLRRDTHEQIRFPNTRLFQVLRRSRIPHDRKDLHIRKREIQALLIRIHQDDILILLR